MRRVNRAIVSKPGRRPAASFAVGLSALLLAGSVQVCVARTPSQAAFASPEDASRALVAAVHDRDEATLSRILGAGGELVSSDDEVQDTLERERFVQKYQEMHRLARAPGPVAILYIGAENWPFPIPLVSRKGVWLFDAHAGADEMRFRRVGENEVRAIGSCHTLVAAETHRQSDSEAHGPIEAVFPDMRPGAEPLRLNGYEFRILSNVDGGFGVIAYPAIYRSSGVMTFVVDRNDVVREKDLGPDTSKVASAMTTYRVDSSWAPSESAH